MTMTLAEIEASIKSLSLIDKRHVLQILMRELEDNIRLDEQTELKRQLTLEALMDVDEGRFLDQNDVAAWADSLGTDSPLPLPRQ